MLLSEGQMSDHKAPGSCFLRFRLRRRPSATAAMIPAGSAPRLPRKPSRRAFPRPGTARSQSRTTRYSTDSATKSRTCLANSRTGGASQPATTDAPTPSSRRSASQTACLRSALGLPGPGLRAVSGTDQRLGRTWRWLRQAQRHRRTLVHELGGNGGAPGAWTREVVDRRIHGATGEAPIDRFRPDEAQALKSLAGTPTFSAMRDLIRSVGADCAVAIDSRQTGLWENGDWSSGTQWSRPPYSIGSSTTVTSSPSSAIATGSAKSAQRLNTKRKGGQFLLSPRGQIRLSLDTARSSTWRGARPAGSLSTRCNVPAVS